MDGLNRFWGWGGEDDDIRRRINKAGLQLTRYSPLVARYNWIWGIMHSGLKYSLVTMFPHIVSAANFSYFVNKLEKDFDLQVRYLYFKINFNFICTAKLLTFLNGRKTRFEIFHVIMKVHENQVNTYEDIHLVNDVIWHVFVYIWMVEKFCIFFICTAKFSTFLEIS